MTVGWTGLPSNSSARCDANAATRDLGESQHTAAQDTVTASGEGSSSNESDKFRGAMVSTFEKRARRIRRSLRRYPKLQPAVNWVGRRAWQRHLARAGGDAQGGADPARIVWIDPASLTRAYRREHVLEAAGGVGTLRDAIGRIVDGDWDRADIALDEIGHFEAIRQRAEGAQWDDIQFIREVRAGLLKGVPSYKFRRLDDVEPQLGRIDALLEQIRTEGYRSQSELGTGRPWDEIVLAIDRKGRVRFVDGRHRLAVARALGLPRVPAIVSLRHPDWSRFSSALRVYSQERGGASYQPILHPDLADIPAEQGDERFDTILEHMPVRTGRLLDIGANKGYFCHRFEAVGFQCTAVERSEKELYFLTGLRDAGECRFDVFAGSAFDTPELDTYDVVLALNIFHHFLKDREAFERFEAFLGALRPSVMVFEPHLPDDPQMASAFKNFTPAEFVSFLSERLSMDRAEQIGAASDGRPLYLLRAGTA